MIDEVIRIDIGLIVKTGDGIGKIEVDLGIKKIIGEDILEVMSEWIKHLKDKAVGESTEMKVMVEVEIGTDLEKGHFLETLVAIETIGVQAVVGPYLDQGQGQIEIRYWKCRECDHLTKDCPTSRKERENIFNKC